MDQTPRAWHVRVKRFLPARLGCVPSLGCLRNPQVSCERRALLCPLCLPSQLKNEDFQCVTKKEAKDTYLLPEVRN